MLQDFFLPVNMIAPNDDCSCGGIQLANKKLMDGYTAA